MKKNSLWRIQILLTIVVAAASFFIICSNLPNRLEIYYYGNNSSSYQDDVAQVFYDYGNGYLEEQSSSVRIFKRLAGFNYNKQNQELQSVRIDFTNTNEKFGIDRIEIRSGMFSIYRISGKELTESGTFFGCDDIQIEDDHVWVTPADGDASYLLSGRENYKFVSKIQEDRWGKISYLAVFMLFLLFNYILTYVFCKRKESDKVYVICSYISLVVLALIIFMGTMSITYGHPDEDETRGSIDYYLSHWGLPDFDDKSLENSFSNYGTIRLKECSIYYFLAGKFGIIFKELFHISSYYRMFNIFLFVILVLYMIIKARNHKWLFFPLLLTPQLWYLYAYATSDAWDYLVSFFVISEAILSESFVTDVLKKGWKRKQLLQMILYAFLCAQIFVAKDNFYLVLLLAFLILLFRLFETKEKKELFVKYIFILVATLSIFGLRIGIDHWRYQGQKDELYREARVGHISPEIKEHPSLQKQGMSLSETYTQYREGFAKTSFESFTGYYGWMTLKSSYYYYHMIALLYILMLGYLYSRLRSRWKMISITGACTLLYLVMIYHSWTVDYQAQGRYLLPCLLGVAYLVAESKVMEDKKFQRVFLLTVCLGGYSFARYGIVPLMLY